MLVVQMTPARSTLWHAGKDGSQMARRLNHGHLMFKTFGRECESSGCGKDHRQQSIQELKKEIDECDLCQKIGLCRCAYHRVIRYDDLIN